MPNEDAGNDLSHLRPWFALAQLQDRLPWVRVYGDLKRLRRSVPGLSFLPTRKPGGPMPKKAKVQATEPRPSTPMSAKVQEDEDFLPLAVSLEGKVLEVVSIDERVEEEAEW